MMRLRLLLSSVLCLAISFAATGQEGFKKAEKLLNLKAFDLAIKNYEAALANQPDHATGYAQLGEAYLMTNQLLKAIKSYEKAFSLDENVDPKYKLQYGTSLKKVGLYDLAESVFFEYAATDQKVAHHMLESTEYAKTLLQRADEYDILNYEFNSAKSDFGVSLYKDNMVFCSFRDDMSRENDKKNESFIHQSGNQLFIAPKNGVDKKVSFLRPDYKEVNNLGPLSYSKDGRMVAFMRNTFTSGSNQIYSDESNMSIYIALTNEDGDFTDEKPFTFNEVEYSYAFPNLGFNGNALYFASNKPGGYGGFDLYVSYFKDGEWSAPENLGATINSSGNEITPFFDGERLYFSSDYHYGLGGYDNFVVDVSDGQWNEVVNLGKGINSPSDDYYLVPDMTEGTMMFTSNRLGGRGKDDIYIAHPLVKQMDLIASANEDVPEAIRLDDLAKPSDTMEDMEMMAESTEATVVSVSSEESVAVMAEEEMFLDYDGAKLISITAENNIAEDEFAEVYFIQLASLTQSEGNIDSYNQLASYGQLYRFFKSSSVKIRLGYFGTRNEAETVLKDVKRAGYNDAFITRDILASSSYEVLNQSTSNQATEWINDYNPESSYKVKLASYLDPLKFRVDDVLDIGRLEQWSKGKWTIFILGGFETIDEAKQARIRAINRGFVDAELIEDNNGIISKVKMQ